MLMKLTPRLRYLPFLRSTNGTTTAHSLITVATSHLSICIPQCCPIHVAKGHQYVTTGIPTEKDSF